MLKNTSLTQLWFLGLAFKLILTAWLPLFSDEAYYWVWSHNLQLSYYDHPPFIAWLLYLGQGLESWGHMVRWPSVLVGHLTFLAWYQILKNHFDEEKLRVWCFLAFFTPLSGMGLMITTPDLPLLLFWSLALWSMDRMIEDPSKRWYALLGASLGLGFCSKYHIVLFVPFLFLWLTLYRKWTEVKWAWVPLTILCGLVFSLPVLIWNFQNDWVSFKFQLDHGLGAQEWKPKWTWRYFYGQLALIFPTVLFYSCRVRKLTTMTWLPVFAWGPIVFFLFTSFKGKVEANWTGVAYPSLIVLALVKSSTLNWAKWTCRIWGVALLLVVSHIAYPWFPIKHQDLKTYELVKYNPLAKAAESYKPFYASTFQMAASISYKNKEPIFKLRGFGRRDFYDFLPGSMPTTDIYFFAAQKWDRLPAWAVQAGHTVVNRYPMTDRYVLFEVQVPKNGI